MGEPVTRTSIGTILLGAALLSFAISRQSASNSWPPLDGSANPDSAPAVQRDYRIAPLERLTPDLEKADKTCLTCQGEQENYLTSADDVVALIRYRGRHVDLLLPSPGSPAGDWTARRIWRLIDHLDLIYEQFLDLIGEEPEGPSKLPVAFVPRFSRSGVLGLADLGGKGVEILDDEALVAEITASLDSDILHGLFVHEMAHNFDVFSNQLSYLADQPHAWTAFLQPYITYVSRLGSLERTPAEQLESQLYFWHRFLNAERADWLDCVKFGRCPEVASNSAANQLWGGFTIAIGMLHGTDAIRGAMDFLREARNAGSWPINASDAEDLHVEALSRGAEVNLSCYVEKWRWHASEDLRQRMADRFGDTAAFCADQDGDGWSVLNGDCDAQDRHVFPGAFESINGVDDDCNGLVDEDHVEEPERADFTDPTRVQPPALLEGQVARDDRDRFLLRASSARHLEVRLCGAGNFNGSLEISDPGGRLIGELKAYEPEPVCDRGRFPFPESGQLAATVAPDPQATDPFAPYASAGHYLLSVDTVPPWPSTPWGRIKKVKNVDGVLRFKVRTKDLSAVTGTPTHLRFWVSGVGFVATKPWAKRVRFDWRPDHLQTPAAELSVRAQLLARGDPISRLAPARFYRRPEAKRDERSLASPPPLRER